jgi:acetate kinase
MAVTAVPGDVITVNGGSSTIKLAVYAVVGDAPQRTIKAQVDRVGRPDSRLTGSRADGSDRDTRSIQAADHRQAAEGLIDWLRKNRVERVRAIAHRVVHGGVHLTRHEVITPALVARLREAQCLDLAHLPREIELIEAFGRHFPDVPQAACFDTAFHQRLPRVAQLLPIPRRYIDAGVRRLGFHGLSYTYLLEKLLELGEGGGRVILAHLGSGASMAAVRDGEPIDTTMGFTPAAGLVMETRPGDLDPGLLVHLMRSEKLDTEQMDQFVSRDCGLTGVSDGTSDMRELLTRRTRDPRAADAVDLFCYTARKSIGACTAALGGLDTLVFSAGIGEHAPEVRAGICDGLAPLGIEIDNEKNAASAAIISTSGSRVMVRVIPTDEEIVMAKIVLGLTKTRSKAEAQ